MDNLEKLIEKLVKIVHELNRLLRARNKPLPPPKTIADSGKGKKAKPSSEGQAEEATKADDYGLCTFVLDDPTELEAHKGQEFIASIAKTIERQKNRKPSKKRDKPQAKKESGLPPTENRAVELKDYFDKFKNKPRKDMICFVMYDIENNRVRKKIADYLEEKGLQRVQYSVFVGQIDRRVFQQMFKVLAEIQESFATSDSIMLAPFGENDMRTMKLIGKKVDWELVFQRENTMFF